MRDKCAEICSLPSFPLLLFFFLSLYDSLSSSLLILLSLSLSYCEREREREKEGERRDHANDTSLVSAYLNDSGSKPVSFKSYIINPPKSFFSLSLSLSSPLSSLRISSGSLLF